MKKTEISGTFIRPAVIIPLIILALLTGFRIALPSIVAHTLNNYLNNIPGYSAKIGDVRLQLLKGAYSIHDFSVNNEEQYDEKLKVVFSVRAINLSVDWHAIFQGHLVGRIEFTDPKLNILSEPQKIKKRIEKKKFSTEELVKQISNFMPFKINVLLINNGEIHFLDTSADPPIDLFLKEIKVIARNLTNSNRISNDLWATVSGEAISRGDGTVNLDMRLNPYKKSPTYQLAFNLKNLRLPSINDYLKQYLSVVARDGKFSLYAESTAKNGQFEGYAKPFVKNLNLIYIKKNKKSVGETIKGFFIKMITKIFKNKPEQQVATKVTFSGSFENPNIGIVDAVLIFIRNAFVEALKPGFDKSVAPGQAEKAEEKKDER